MAVRNIETGSSGACACARLRLSIKQGGCPLRRELGIYSRRLENTVQSRAEDRNGLQVLAGEKARLVTNSRPRDGF